VLLSAKAAAAAQSTEASGATPSRVQPSSIASTQGGAEVVAAQPRAVSDEQLDGGFTGVGAVAQARSMAASSSAVRVVGSIAVITGALLRCWSAAGVVDGQAQQRAGAVGGGPPVGDLVEGGEVVGEPGDAAADVQAVGAFAGGQPAG
jgi:hypothetical protein